MARKSEQRSRASARKRMITQDNLAAFDKLRVNTDENSIKWLFHRGTDLQWRWEKASGARGVIATSQTVFATFFECVSNARSAGYKEWIAPARLTPLSFSHQPMLSVETP